MNRNYYLLHPVSQGKIKGNHKNLKVSEALCLKFSKVTKEAHFKTGLRLARGIQQFRKMLLKAYCIAEAFLRIPRFCVKILLDKLLSLETQEA